MKSPRTLPRSRAAFTLVEVVISGALMASLLLVAGLATERAMELFRQRRAADAVAASANRLLQRVTNELLFARQASFLPAPPFSQGLSSLSFQKCMGVQAGAVLWSTRFSLAWELEPSEVEDGLDNNGNGLIDEGQLVWTENEGEADEQRVVWAHGLCTLLPGETLDNTDEDGDGLIDERGLCFAMEADVLTIRLGLQAIGPDGNTITRVVETSVLLRN